MDDYIELTGKIYAGAVQDHQPRISEAAPF